MKLLDLARIAEPIDLLMHEAFWQALPPSLANEKKVQLHRVGDALVFVTPRSTSLQRNRVLGLGVHKQARESMIDEILDRFREARVTRFSLHLSPSRQSNIIGTWLKERGFKLHHSYAKLIRNTDEIIPASTHFQIRRIGKSGAQQFVETFGKTFPLTAHRRPWIAITVGREGFDHFLAYADGNPVATALLFTNGDRAWMGWASTLTKFRRRGAHSALIAARVSRAAKLGAKWIVCETLAPLPRRPSGSYRNLLKHGFTAAYLRPIWVWEK